MAESDFMSEQSIAASLTPSLLDARLQSLITGVWAWGHQLRQNESRAQMLSPLLSRALFSYKQVVSNLERVIEAFYFGNTTERTRAELESDIKEFEDFARLLCGDEGEKLILTHHGDVVFVFPRGAPFFSYNTLFELYADCKIEQKAVKLKDVQLRNSFKVSLELFITMMQDVWISDKASFGLVIDNDQEAIVNVRTRTEQRLFELTTVLGDLENCSRNEICRDRRIKDWNDKVSVAVARERVHQEMSEAKALLVVCRCQTRFYEQICAHYNIRRTHHYDYPNFDLSLG